MIKITHVPRDVLRTIIMYIPDAKGFLSLTRVSRLFHELTSEPRIQECMKEQLSQDRVDDNLRGRTCIRRCQGLPNGVLHGPCVVYAHGFKLYYRCNWNNGKLDGLYDEFWIEYNGDVPYSRAQFRDGVRDGIATWWWWDGQIRRIETYDNGKLVGAPEHLDIHGNIQETSGVQLLMEIKALEDAYPAIN